VDVRFDPKTNTISIIDPKVENSRVELVKMVDRHFSYMNKQHERVVPVIRRIEVAIAPHFPLSLNQAIEEMNAILTEVPETYVLDESWFERKLWRKSGSKFNKDLMLLSLILDIAQMGTLIAHDTFTDIPQVHSMYYMLSGYTPSKVDTRLYSIVNKIEELEDRAYWAWKGKDYQRALTYYIMAKNMFNTLVTELKRPEVLAMLKQAGSFDIWKSYIMYGAGMLRNMEKYAGIALMVDRMSPETVSNVSGILKNVTPEVYPFIRNIPIELRNWAAVRRLALLKKLPTAVKAELIRDGFESLTRREGRRSYSSRVYTYYVSRRGYYRRKGRRPYGYRPKGRYYYHYSGSRLSSTFMYQLEDVMAWLAQIVALIMGGHTWYAGDRYMDKYGPLYWLFKWLMDMVYAGAGMRIPFTGIFKPSTVRTGRRYTFADYYVGGAAAFPM